MALTIEEAIKTKGSKGYTASSIGKSLSTAKRPQASDGEVSASGSGGNNNNNTETGSSRSTTNSTTSGISSTLSSSVATAGSSTGRQATQDLINQLKGEAAAGQQANDARINLLADQSAAGALTSDQILAMVKGLSLKANNDSLNQLGVDMQGSIAAAGGFGNSNSVLQQMSASQNRAGELANSQGVLFGQLQDSSTNALTGAAAILGSGGTTGDMDALLAALGMDTSQNSTNSGYEFTQSQSQSQSSTRKDYTTNTTNNKRDNLPNYGGL